MAFTAEDVAHVRKGWSAALGDVDTTAKTFYENLFKIDPGTRALFMMDINYQGSKLTDTLDFIIDNVDDLDMLVPAAQDLAIRHVAYGVTVDHYAAVGGALIQTLRDLLGNGFSDDEEKAWSKVYETLSGVMIQSAYH